MTMKINDNGVDRNMTKAEQAAHEAASLIAQAEHEAREKAQADRAKAREAVITKLGLTADEVAALLS